MLVADDDPLMSQLLTRIPARENYELLIARDVGEALTLAEGYQADIDLLVTDCEMPVMKGPELAERLRGTRPRLKVLFQTGFADMLFAQRPVLDDDSAFLEKPFTARGLQEAARLALFGTLTPRVDGGGWRSGGARLTDSSGTFQD